MTNKEKFMQEAFLLAKDGMRNNEGGPFGAVIVQNNIIVGKGYNQVTSTNDPTAHAEIQAIRAACKKLNTFELNNCEIYTNCEPCPMCLAAIYWAHLSKIYYAANRQDAANIGFDDDFIYAEIGKAFDERAIPVKSLLTAEALKIFAEWKQMPNKIPY